MQILVDFQWIGISQYCDAKEDIYIDLDFNIFAATGTKLTEINALRPQHEYSYFQISIQEELLFIIMRRICLAMKAGPFSYLQNYAKSEAS